MFKSTIQLTFFSIIGIFINFVIQLLIAYYFGATNERDVYFASITFPTYLTTLFTGSIGMVILPQLMKFKSEHSKLESQKYISSILNFTIFIVLSFIVVFYFLASPIMCIFLTKSNIQLFALGVVLFKIQLFSVFFTLLNNLLINVFQVENSFVIPAITPLLTSLVTIVFVSLFAPSMGIKSLSLGNLLGYISATILLFFSASRSLSFKWNTSMKYNYTRYIYSTSIPLFIAGIIFRSTTVFERFIAAKLPSGSLSYLGSASQIIVILSTLVSSGIATTSFPILSKQWNNRDLKSLENTFTGVIHMIIICILPIVIIFIVCGKELIKLLFEHGEFTGRDTLGLYYILLPLMAHLLFVSIGNVTARMLYLTQNTKISAIIGLCELIIYIVFSFGLVKYLGYVGLGVSVAIGAAFNVIATLFFSKRYIVKFSLKNLSINAIRLVINSLLVFLAVKAVAALFLNNVNPIFRITLIVIFVLPAYFFLSISIIKKNFIYLKGFKTN